MGTMLATTILTFFVIRFGWGYPLTLCIAATGLFIFVDAAFFSASLVKIADGGWFPLFTGGALFFLMTTWRRGRQLMNARLRSDAVPLQTFVDSLLRDPPHRVPGTAVFLTTTPDATPSALMHNLKHNRVLHEQIVFLTVETLEVPHVPLEDRVVVEPIGQGCWRATVRFGFKDSTDVPEALRVSRARAFDLDLMRTSYFLSRDTIAPLSNGSPAMAPWRKRIFAAMVRNASNAADYFRLPTNRVIELGSQVEI